MTLNKILILILNWNGKKDTLECLSSLSSVTYPPFTTLVVDNGSRDDSVATIRREFPQTQVLETGENLGFAGGNNVGIKWALEKGYEWILLLNNDTTVAPDFLEGFLKASQEKPEAKILGAKIYRHKTPNQIDHLGGIWDAHLGEFLSLHSGQIDDGISMEVMEQVDYVCGAALFMHRSVPEAIGLLEPRYFLFWEESDFCVKAKRKGFAIWTAPQAKIWHKVSSSFTGGKPQMHYFWWRSRLLWISLNCTAQEKRRLYRKVILPSLWKTTRHYLLRTAQNKIQKLLFQKIDPKQREKELRNRAGLIGAIHYFFGKFGNCPPSIYT